MAGSVWPPTDVKVRSVERNEVCFIRAIRREVFSVFSMDASSSSAREAGGGS